MMFPHLWYAPKEMASRVEDLRRQAEIHHMHVQFMGSRKPPERHRLLLCRLGRRLVALGHRLEQYGPPPCTPLEGGIGFTG